MTVLEGNFAVHKTTTAGGRNAILVIPESDEEILLLDECPISFERVEGRVNPPDSYLTIIKPNGDKVCIGPPAITEAEKN